MQQDLLDACNVAGICAIYGTGVSNAVRSMLQMVKGAYVLKQLSETDDTVIAAGCIRGGSSVKMSANEVIDDSPVVTLAPVFAFNNCKQDIHPSRRNRYWVWVEGDLQVTEDDCFDAVIQVKDGRIISAEYTEVNRSFEVIRTENLGTWYAYCMTLYNDVIFRMSYQNLGLLLTNIYSFIEYTCAKKGDARNLTTCKKVLDNRYYGILGDLFKLRLLFNTEPFNRRDIWMLMQSILSDDSFYELLQLYFSNSYRELQELKSLKYLVAIEMDKEGL